MVDLSTKCAKDNGTKPSPNETAPRKSDAELRQLRDFITFRLSRLQAKLNMQAADILKKNVDLTVTEWRTIAFVEMLQPTGVAELSQELGHDKSLLSRNVQKLRAKGLILEVNDSEDNRRTLVSLSQKGRDLYRTNLSRMRKRQTALMRDISDADYAVLIRCLDTLQKNAEQRDFE